MKRSSMILFILLFFVEITFALDNQNQENNTKMMECSEEFDQIVLNLYRNKFINLEEFFHNIVTGNRIYSGSDYIKQRARWHVIAKKRIDDYMIYLVGIGTPFGRNKKSKLLISILDIRNKKILSEFNLWHNFYGNSFWKIQLDAYKTCYRDKYIFIQIRHGGDASHTENRLRMFSWDAKSIKEELNINIDKPVFNHKDNKLKSITGSYVLSFCAYCDGWEISDPADLFLLPIEIDFGSKIPKVSCTLKQKEKESIMKRFNMRKEKPIGYEDKYLEKYIKSLEKDFFEVINMENDVWNANRRSP